ncbi:unnamed protein product [Cylindrotheca closterium]|uniref:Uncharacterized protein n=1 Tax=Cylindrotheca closterium TaxID=2856 RepID=A0AAD2CK61_9STRA|nr:unnamed protein product [Cylindrotheca closterium]
MTRLQWLLKKGHRQKYPPLENDITGLSEGDRPRHRRSTFSFFNSKNDHGYVSGGSGGEIKTKEAGHNRTESNETSLTNALTINTELSYSGEERFDPCYIGESSGSFEVLSPHHMIQYGKSLLELETREGGTESSRDQYDDEISSSSSENSYVEGLSCIMEESSREAESDCSIGIASRAGKMNPPSPVPFSSQWDGFGPMNPLDYIIYDSQKSDIHQTKSSQMNSLPPRMIQMDGSILSPTGNSWTNFGTDSSPQSNFIRNRTKPTTVPVLGINNSIINKKLINKSQKEETTSSSATIVKEVNPASSFEGMRDQSPTLYNTRAPSTQSGFRDEDNSGFKNVLVDHRTKSHRNHNSSDDGSADRMELLKPKYPIKKIHLRSSRSWLHFFSRPFSGENSSVSLYKLVVPSSATDDSEQNSRYAQEKSLQKLADGTVRFEI